MEFPFNSGTDEYSQINCDISIQEIDQFHSLTDNENIQHTTCEEMEVETVNVEEFDGNVEAGNHDMPYVGQQFQSEKDAYNAYNAYALFKGFGIRLDRTAISQKTRVVIRRVIVCKKEGKKNIREKNFDGKLIENRRRSTRTECKARMILALNQTTGLWSITSFNDDHNHELTTPSKSGKHRSHKEFHRLASTRRLINTLHGEGMGPTEIATVVNVHAQVGGEIERITPQECHDQSRKFRRNNIGNECVSVINHFMELRNKDPLFFFAIELDEEKTLRSVFWADGRSINSYLEFSDVVVFDVTYRTNKFAMPFAPFTGVNHHRQSILFGCALIADETEATFVWLFQQWLKCMCGKSPGVIITDQDKAMGNAIKKVFPMTRHRYCSWHIDKHVTQHLSHLISTFQEFWNDYQEWFWSESIPESESRWEIFIDKYGLYSNDWMMNMYDLRWHWVPAYWRDVFTAGMRTTQRSESMNSFFDGFIHAMTPLNEFVTQYEKALVARRTAEYDEDFRTMDSMPILDASLPMESQAAKFYTRSMYDRFRHEFSQFKLYFEDQISDDGATSVYSVWNSTNPSSKQRVVMFGVTENGLTLSCSCAKFEMEGMLCRHIFHIMIRKRVLSVPEQYMLKRWSISARYKGSGCNSSSNTSRPETMEVTPLEQFSIRVVQNRMFEKASLSKEVYGDYLQWMEEKLATLDLQDHQQNLASACGSNLMPLCRVPSFPSSSQQLEAMPEILVRDPSRAFSTKGRPSKPTRICSGVELSKQHKEKKKVTCSHCNARGHNKVGCPLRKAGNAGNTIPYAEPSEFEYFQD